MSIQHFGHLEAPNPNEATKQAVGTVYTGGDYRLNMPVVDGFTRVAMAWELGGWHSDDLVPACVLQTLLGGGSSFSAGGPGKGMYSRLYREVLNRFYWAESAEAFNMFHEETGLVGLSGSAPPEKARDVTRVLAEHMARLALEPVTDEELSRARNMLKCNVLTQLESRLVLFEDIGRQILTYGKREGTAEMCAKIDAVTAQDIQEIARKAITKPPTLASVGENISNVPAYEEIASWFSH
jgi:processing peptidase subunit alpha